MQIITGSYRGCMQNRSSGGGGKSMFPCHLMHIKKKLWLYNFQTKVVWVQLNSGAFEHSVLRVCEIYAL